jgi:hypothetical protein
MLNIRLQRSHDRGDKPVSDLNSPRSMAAKKSIHEEQQKHMDYEDGQEEKGYKTINELKVGGYFGEISLMTNLKRTCSVFAINNVIVGMVSKKDFKQLTESSTDLRNRVYNKMATYKDQTWR